MEKEKPTFEEILKACKKSIKHWEEVAEDPENEATSEYECALCELFFFKSDECVGCPIYEKTGHINCVETPFLAFIENRTRENALAEVVFLKNLYIEMLEKGDDWNKIEKRRGIDKPKEEFE